MACIGDELLLSAHIFDFRLDDAVGKCEYQQKCNEYTGYADQQRQIQDQTEPKTASLKGRD